MDLILNQTKIPRDRWRYGLRRSAATGCGCIAGYNALLLLGRPETPEAELVRFKWGQAYRKPRRRCFPGLFAAVPC